MHLSALKPAALWAMTKESVVAWTDDFAPSMGAAIAYYTAFSIAPLLIIVIGIAGLFFDREAATGRMYAQIAGLVGDDGAKAVQGLVESAGRFGDGLIPTLVGIALLLVGATTVFGELQTDLDRIWKAPAAKKPEGLWGMLRSRVLSLGMVISIGFLLLVSLVISAMLAALGQWWGGVFGEFEWLLQAIDFVVGLAVVTALFALMYKILPRVSIGWRDVWIGAAVTALLFTIGKFLVGLYLGKSGVASGFGAAGSLVVLMVWVYYSSQIFLLGAEFTWVYAHRYGSRQGKDQPATAKETLATTQKPEGEAAATEVGARVPSGNRAASPAVHAPTPRPPAPAHGVPAHAYGASTIVRRHPGMIAGVALLAGAVAGEILNRREQGRSRSLGALAGALLGRHRANAKLRKRLRAELAPRARSRLFGWLGNA
jgi:membrane protein